MKMTPEQFERESDPSGEMRQMDAVIVPCECPNDVHCPGWTWVTRREYEDIYADQHPVR